MSHIPPAVRILPMDSDENEFAGKSVEEVQRDFFLRDLRAEPRRGRYLFRSQGLKAARGTVVLFQHTGRIIASATFDRIERFDEPKEDIYSGALYFDTDSVRVFDPVGPDLLRQIWPKFKGFNQGKQSLDPQAYPAFERELSGVEGCPTESQLAAAPPGPQA